MVFAASVALLAFATAAFAQGDFVINTPYVVNMRTLSCRDNPLTFGFSHPTVPPVLLLASLSVLPGLEELVSLLALVDTCLVLTRRFAAPYFVVRIFLSIAYSARRSRRSPFPVFSHISRKSARFLLIRSGNN